MQQFNNGLFTPLKKNNLDIISSNKFQNFSSSSGILWGRMKEFNNNMPMIQNYPKLNPYQKGRKLIEDFNKFPKNNESDNENPINNNNNNPINDNKSNNIDKNGNTNYNISFNNFSFLTPNNRTLKEKEKEKEKLNDENEKDSDIKNNLIKTTSNKIIIDNNESNDINNNNTINTNQNANANHNMFFTDYGLGYKCNCQKTQCNKFYCQCYNQGRYCFNCNCIDCNNKKPESVPTNKHQAEEETKDKKVITISCTCTKSGCNKNYCECFKSKVKCTELCRCRNCENCEKGKNCKKKFSGESNTNYFELECCPANSVFIIKNKIVFENVDKYKNKINKKNDPIRREIRLTISDNLLSSFSSEENQNQKIGHKRKRYNMKNDKNTSEKKSKSKLSEDENTNDMTKIKSKNYIEGGLFDKNGKLILTNFNI